MNNENLQSKRDRIIVFFHGQYFAFYSKYVKLNKRTGNVKIPSPFRSETQPSFQIDLTGRFAGKWHDFGTGEHGDIIDFYQKISGIDQWAEAIEKIINEFNIPGRNIPKGRVDSIKKAIKDAGAEESEYKSYGLSWMREYEERLFQNEAGSLDYLLGKRGISKDTIRHFHLGFSESYEPQSKRTLPCIMIPHIKGDRILLIKKRAISEKVYWREAGMQSVLFNEQALEDDKEKEAVYICEGEFDAMVLWECGFKTVVSGTTGAGSFQTDWVEKTKNFNQVVIAYDADKSGQDGVKQLVLRLGEDRARIVKLPEESNDINDLFLSEGQIGIVKIVRAARGMPVEHVTSLADSASSLLEKLKKGQAIDDGYPWPWEQMTAKWGPIVGGRVIGLSGGPGLGKSTLGIQVATHLASKENVPSLVCCLEMTPEELFLFVIQQHLEKEREEITAPLLEAVIDEYSEWPLFFQSHDGVVEIDEVIETFTAAYKRFGVRFFVLDNLRILTRAYKDELWGQGNITLRLKRWTVQYNTSVLLLAHPRKMEPGQIEGLGDISGNAAAGADFDESLTIWRKNLQPKNEEELLEPEVSQGDLFHPVTCFLKTKGRFGGSGRVWLFHEGKYRRFRRLRDTDEMPTVDPKRARR